MIHMFFKKTGFFEPFYSNVIYEEEYGIDIKPNKQWT